MYIYLFFAFRKNINAKDTYVRQIQREYDCEKHLELKFKGKIPAF